jgi:hypothetical protein
MKTLKITACLSALFLLGAASGFGISRARIPSSLQSFAKSETAVVDRLLNETNQRLHLTVEQEPIARKSYEELASGVRAIRQETAVKVRELVIQKGTDLWKVLTPEQRVEFKKLNEERRERWQRFQP